jgi:hypothetical protein
MLGVAVGDAREPRELIGRELADAFAEVDQRAAVAKRAEAERVARERAERVQRGVLGEARIQQRPEHPLAQAEEARRRRRLRQHERLAGAALGVVGQVLLTRLSPHGTYAGELLAGLIITGLGVGSLFSAAISGGTLGVKPSDAGIAGALVNTSVQIGGSVGPTVLSTVFATAVTSYAAGHARTAGLADAAALHGYTTAFWWAAGIFALGLLVATFIFPRRPQAQQAAPQQPTRTPRAKSPSSFEQAA